MRHLERKASPTGLMQITMCSLSCTLLMKWANMPSLGRGEEEEELGKNAIMHEQGPTS